MAKLDPLTTITSGFNSTAQLNENFTKIDAAFTNTLSRDGSSPNAMGAALDMNSNRIINLTDPVNNQDAVTKSFFEASISGDVDIAAAAASAAAALVSETNSAASATAAALVENSQITFKFDSSTSMADPGVGDFRYNNATVASVTAIAFDASMAQTGDPDVSDYIATWDDSTNAVTGHVTLSKRGNNEVFAIFNVTAVADNTGWLQVTVTHVSSSGTFSDTDTVDIMFSRAGDTGGTLVSADITGQSAATVVLGDSFVFTDVGDSDNLKKDTVQGIVDLVASDLSGKADTVITALDKITFYDNADSDNPKTDTVQGLVDLISAGTQAIQAAIVAETNEDTYIPPDLLKHNPGVGKAWAHIDMTGTMTLEKSHNVSGIVDNGVGLVTVSWDTDFIDVNYVIAGMTENNSYVTVVNGVPPAVGSAQLRCESNTGTPTDADPMMLIAMGEQ